MQRIVARTFASRIVTVFTVLFATCVGLANASAQSIPPPPVRATVDVNGVDLVDGSLWVYSPSISIGQAGSGGLSYTRWFDSSVQAWRDNYTGTINSSGATYTVTLFGASQRFTLASGVYTPDAADGSSLTFDSGNNEYTYTSRYGAIAIIDKDFAGSSPTQANEGRITSYTEPDGERTIFNYVTLNSTTQRLQSVTNNFGYQLKFDYFGNSGGDFLRLVRVTALNNAVDYCNPSADTCSYTQTWPNLQFNAALPTEITDTLNRVTTYAYTSSRITSVESPEGVTLTVTYSSTTGRVEEVTDGDGTWEYDIPTPTGARNVTVYNPVGATYGIGFNASNTLSEVSNGGLVTTYAYDGNNRLTSMTAPTGVRAAFQYDARGNVTQTTQIPITGSGLSNVVSTASFVSTCSNVVTCNLPTSTTDSRGFRTDYTYDSTHGGLLSVTAPGPTGDAPTGDSPRPQTRFTYDDFYAYYKNSGGSIAAASTAVWLPIETSACATDATCANGADETRTVIAYGADSVANNRLPVSQTIRSGNTGSGSISITTGFTYDAVGNLLTVDGPLSGTDDTTRVRYDAMRQTIGAAGPDPDAGGAGLHRAQRLTYNDDGQVIVAEQGTVTSQSDGAWASFATLEQVNTTYDGQGRPVTSAFVAQSATQAVMQYAYDDASRLLCQTVRMNPAVFGSLPSDACTLGTQGSHGPDRITRLTYDFNSQVTQVTTGYGTGSPINEVTTAYAGTALPMAVTDGQGNRTGYEYDGFARLTRTYYPRPDLPGTSSTTDYEQYTYNNAASVVTQVRRRDGQTIAFAYDNLLRVITLDAPSTANDVSYTYDLFSRQLTAVLDPTGTPRTSSFAYDQLSRVTSAGSPLGTVSYQYDAASRRTQMTWPDSLYVDYDYDLTNAVTGIRENGATSGAGVLATFAYDNLGRRTSLTRGNGVVTSYAFDAASRLVTLTQNLTGTTSDLTRTFDYNAGAQIVERGASNAAYNTPTPNNGATNYLDNGLNQYTAITQAQPTYDARGNMTRVGLSTFSYDIFNRLDSATPAGASAATFAYDALGRLRESVASSTTTRFLYDGVQVIGEFDGSNALQRRYVFGPGINEPLVWYEGSGTSDRRWLLGDERGSIIAVTNGSGAATNINAYDEYGVPSSTNTGTFQYTGQMWLPGARLYHYRARAYSAELGRFMQTDPIGFGGGMNIYAYVWNDAVNLIDPLGLQDLPIEEVFVTFCRSCREAIERARDRAVQRALERVRNILSRQVQNAGSEIKRIVECPTYNAGVSVDAAWGPGLVVDGGARWDGSSSALSLYLDADPAAGEGAHLLGVVGVQRPDAGPQFSPSRIRPPNFNGGRVGGGVAVSGAVALDERGFPAGAEVGLGAGGGWVASVDSGTAATAVIADGEDNPNCPRP